MRDCGANNPFIKAMNEAKPKTKITVLSSHFELWTTATNEKPFRLANGPSLPELMPVMARASDIHTEIKLTRRYWIEGLPEVYVFEEFRDTSKTMTLNRPSFQEVEAAWCEMTDSKLAFCVETFEGNLKAGLAQLDKKNR